MSWSSSPWPSALRGAAGVPAARPQPARLLPRGSPSSLRAAGLTQLYPQCLRQTRPPALPSPGQCRLPHPDQTKCKESRLGKSNIYCPQSPARRLLRPGQGSPRGRRGWEPRLVSPLPLWVRSSLPFGSFPGLPAGRLWLHARDEGGYQN